MYAINNLSADQSAFEGTITDLTMVGTHTIVINSINGQFDDVSGRGNDGLYDSVLSNTIELTINNPCDDPAYSEVLQITLDDLEVPDGDTTVQVTTDGPNDKVSTTIGTGFGDCGKIAYSILNENGAQI